MLKSLIVFLLAVCFSLPVHTAQAKAPMKEWTFLTFLNGNNNLDSFGAMNINQMEKIGSSDQINVLVQWASLGRNKIERLYVQKDNNTNNVTSPAIQDITGTDMGDWRSVVEFVRWAAENYPAKHYFLNIWDHGSGWHAYQLKLSSTVRPTDISWDDLTGHSITTQQMGQILEESARIIGHKIDVYGSDACLMAMVEVADEMADSVKVFVGSQDLEPGAGWPYDNFLNQWVKTPTATPSEVGTYLVEQYLKSYQGGSNGRDEVTLSAYDLEKISALNRAVGALGSALSKLGSAAQAKLARVAKKTQSFFYSDYVDLRDFIRLLGAERIQGISDAILKDVDNATEQMVVANGVSPGFAKATGVSIWLPSSSSTYNDYSGQYEALKFHSHTAWGDALRSIVANAKGHFASRQ